LRLKAAMTCPLFVIPGLPRDPSWRAAVWIALEAATTALYSSTAIAVWLKPPST
jgi:hypothetical protein